MQIQHYHKKGFYNYQFHQNSFYRQLFFLLVFLLPLDYFLKNLLGNLSKQLFDEKSERALKKQYHRWFFHPGFFNSKKPHDMVSFFFAGFTLFRNVHFLQDKEQAWTGISWLPRPWELARILQNFIFYVNIPSKPSFNDFFFQKISRISSRVNLCGFQPTREAFYKHLF